MENTTPKPIDEDVLSKAIGANVLELLTLGMYKDARNAIREYIQNSLDSLNQAVKKGLIKESEKKVEIYLSEAENSISITDCGTGVASDNASDTLVSIGKSNKIRGEDAGFRGIGRLAGISYCDNLVFETSALGDSTLYKIEYDCKKIRGHFTAGSDDSVHTIRSVLENSCQEIREKCSKDEHFFRVRLDNLTEAGKVFLDFEDLEEYLSEVAPVDFNSQKFAYRSVINEFRNENKKDLSVISITIKRPERSDQHIFKPYKTFTKFRGGKDDVTGIKFINDEYGRYWGWYGVTPLSGAISEDTIAGIRFRVNNILVGDTSISEELFEETAPSNKRLSDWFFGEIHINPIHVIPNGRRDDFEDSDKWQDIKKSIETPLINNLCNLARRRSSYRSIMNKGEKAVQKAQEIMEQGILSQTEKDKNLEKLRAAKKSIRSKMGENSTEEENEKLNSVFEKVENAEKELEVQSKFKDRSLMDVLNRKEMKVIRIVFEVLQRKLSEEKCKDVIEEIERQLRNRKVESEENGK